MKGREELRKEEEEESDTTSDTVNLCGFWQRPTRSSRSVVGLLFAATLLVAASLELLLPPPHILRAARQDELQSFGGFQRPPLSFAFLLLVLFVPAGWEVHAFFDPESWQNGEPSACSCLRFVSASSSFRLFQRPESEGCLK